MHQKLREVVAESGLWTGARERTHGFMLSPDVYELSAAKASELEALGPSLFECLTALGRIAAIAADPRLARGPAWHIIHKALWTGVPSAYHALQAMRPGAAPGICKVDFMEAEDGSLRIAEIDGHNKHGLGYSTLAARLRDVAAPSLKTFQGVASMIAAECRRRGAQSVFLLYADQERFYLPEFAIFRDEMSRCGVETTVISEMESVPATFFAGDAPPLFVDFPFMYHNHVLNRVIAGAYEKGEAEFLIPPKPFYGSKAVLGLLRNDGQNADIEAILRSQIKSAALEHLRAYIPETHMVHKAMPLSHWQELCGNGKSFVLKEVISSGMKGTIFREDPRFDEALRKAAGSYYRAILQAEVRNSARSFRYFDGAGNLCEAVWFMRVTAHYVMRDIADVVVTARQDKKVHGAPDCLQLGAVIK